MMHKQILAIFIALFYNTTHASPPTYKAILLSSPHEQTTTPSPSTFPAWAILTFANTYSHDSRAQLLIGKKSWRRLREAGEKQCDSYPIKHQWCDEYDDPINKNYYYAFYERFFTDINDYNPTEETDTEEKKWPDYTTACNERYKDFNPYTETVTLAKSNHHAMYTQSMPGEKWEELWKATCRQHPYWIGDTRTFTFFQIEPQQNIPTITLILNIDNIYKTNLIPTAQQLEQKYALLYKQLTGDTNGYTVVDTNNQKWIRSIQRLSENNAQLTTQDTIEYLTWSEQIAKQQRRALAIKKINAERMRMSITLDSYLSKEEEQALIQKMEAIIARDVPLTREEEIKYAQHPSNGNLDDYSDYDPSLYQAPLKKDPWNDIEKSLVACTFLNKIDSQNPVKKDKDRRHGKK